MELSQVNSLNINGMSEMNSARSRNVKNVDKSSQNILSQVEVEKVELSSNKQNSFSSNVISNISKIADLQKEQVVISKQINTANEMSRLTTEVMKSPKNGQVLDDIQPKIHSLIGNFNTTSANTEKNGQTNSSASRTYFDGVVGAKPLSGEEIHKAVTQQKERLEQMNKVINHEINSIINSTKQSFNIEKELVQQEKPEFKIDFEKESIKFNAQSLKSFEGSAPVAQANGNPEQSINLLAS